MAYPIRCPSDRYQSSCYRQILTYHLITPDRSTAYAFSIFSFSSLQQEFYSPCYPRTLYLGCTFLLGGFLNIHLQPYRLISLVPVRYKPWQFDSHFHPAIALSPFPLLIETGHILPYSHFGMTLLMSLLGLHTGLLRHDHLNPD